jgi:hypothetical protein
VPVVTCPKCPTKLKVPDGASGNTKCPKCGTVFPVTKPAAPAFEVVDDAPAAPKPAPKTGARPVMKTVAQAKADEEPDFEVVDEKPKKRVVADDDDDDDDAPRKKKKRDDDDDDDEPKARRKKKRDDDDDDDDEDEKPRKKKKKKKKRSDDDDDEWMPSSGNRGAFAKGKTGALLISISFWLNLGSYGLLALYALIAWVALNVESSPPSSSPRSGSSGSGSFMEIIVILPGLVGLGKWIVGIVGLSFCIA